MKVAFLSNHYKRSVLLESMAVELIETMVLLSLHTSFNLAQLALSGKKLLSFLVDLALDLDFNLTKLLLFTA